MKNGLVKDGKEINCRECIYGSVCTVASGHDYKVGSCNQYKETKITNGDRIRSMTDEELANELGFVAQDAFCYGRGLRDKMILFPFESYEEALEWLKQEVE